MAGRRFGPNSDWVVLLVTNAKKVSKGSGEAFGREYDHSAALASRGLAADEVRKASRDAESGAARGWAKSEVEAALNGAIEDAVLGVVIGDQISKETYEDLVRAIRRIVNDVPYYAEVHG